MTADRTTPIGIFGGTFDPVHIGHLRTALEVQEHLAIPDFRFLPAGEPPHRAARVTAAPHRLAMLELAIAGYPRFAIDDRELRRPGPSYMVDTLRELRAEAPDQPLLLIIGQDSANGLDTWHGWRELFDLAHIVVMQRPDHATNYSRPVGREIDARTVRRRGELSASVHGGFYGLEVTQIQVSSSMIRRLVSAGRSPRYLLPEAVRAYIEAHALYT